MSLWRLEPNVKCCPLRSAREKQHCSYLLRCGNKHQKEGGLFAPALPQITSCLVIAIFMGLLSWFYCTGLLAQGCLPVQCQRTWEDQSGTQHSQLVRSCSFQAQTFLLSAQHARVLKDTKGKIGMSALWFWKRWPWFKEVWVLRMVHWQTIQLWPAFGTDLRFVIEISYQTVEESLASGWQWCWEAMRCPAISVQLFGVRDRRSGCNKGEKCNKIRGKKSCGYKALTFCSPHTLNIASTGVQAYTSSLEQHCQLLLWEEVPHMSACVCTLISPLQCKQARAFLNIDKQNDAFVLFWVIFYNFLRFFWVKYPVRYYLGYFPTG